MVRLGPGNCVYKISRAVSTFEQPFFWGRIAI